MQHDPRESQHHTWSTAGSSAGAAHLSAGKVTTSAGMFGTSPAVLRNLPGDLRNRSAATQVYLRENCEPPRTVAQCMQAVHYAMPGKSTTSGEESGSQEKTATR